MIVPQKPLPLESWCGRFHASNAHVHARLLKASVRNSVVTLTGKVWTFEGCAMFDNGLHYLMSSRTEFWSTEKLGRALVDRSRPEDLPALRKTRLFSFHADLCPRTEESVGIASEGVLY